MSGFADIRCDCHQCDKRRHHGYFAEISTEMLNETKNAGQESTGQEGNVSDPDGTGNTEKSGIQRTARARK